MIQPDDPGRKPVADSSIELDGPFDETEIRSRADVEAWYRRLETVAPDTAAADGTTTLRAILARRANPDITDAELVAQHNAIVRDRRARNRARMAAGARNDSAAVAATDPPPYTVVGAEPAAPPAVAALLARIDALLAVLGQWGPPPPPARTTVATASPAPPPTRTPPAPGVEILAVSE